MKKRKKKKAQKIKDKGQEWVSFIKAAFRTHQTRPMGTSVKKNKKKYTRKKKHKNQVEEQ